MSPFIGARARARYTAADSQPQHVRCGRALGQADLSLPDPPPGRNSLCGRRGPCRARGGTHHPCRRVYRNSADVARHRSIFPSSRLTAPTIEPPAGSVCQRNRSRRGHARDATPSNPARLDASGRGCGRRLGLSAPRSHLVSAAALPTALPPLRRRLSSLSQSQPGRRPTQPHLHPRACEMFPYRLTSSCCVLDDETPENPAKIRTISSKILKFPPKNKQSTPRPVTNSDNH
jgi:hypothetical protein